MVSTQILVYGREKDRYIQLLTVHTLYGTRILFLLPSLLSYLSK